MNDSTDGSHQQLEDAEFGDEVYVEFELADEGGIQSVRGTVANVTDTKQPDRSFKRRTIYLESDDPLVSAMNIRMDVGLGTASVRDDIKLASHPDYELEERVVTDWHTIDVVPEVTA